MPQFRKVALVFKTRLEENQRILAAISKFNRFHENWSAFVDDQAVSQQDPSWLLNQSWDGIITRHSTSEFLEGCIKQSIPVVDLTDGPRFDRTVPKFRPDNRAIGHMGAEYFIEKGYQHFAFCGFSSELWALDRENGFKEALELAGRTSQSFDSSYPKANEPDWEQKEEEKIRAWLDDLPQPLALMCCNDLRALQVLHACRQLDLRVPEEVAILGVNNENVRCELSNPQLSSIPVNTDYYGQVAAQCLTDLMNGESPDSLNQLIDPLEVVTRRSTDMLSIDDKHVAEALHIIKNSACEGITVDAIVEQVSVSRSMLERRFRKHIGRSPQEEIRSVQIQKIKQLLKETNYTLAHIAEIAGFDHPEYMSVVFKKQLKMTPIQYRKKVAVSYN